MYAHAEIISASAHKSDEYNLYICKLNWKKKNQETLPENFLRNSQTRKTTPNQKIYSNKKILDPPGRKDNFRQESIFSVFLGVTGIYIYVNMHHAGIHVDRWLYKGYYDILIYCRTEGPLGDRSSPLEEGWRCLSGWLPFPKATPKDGFTVVQDWPWAAIWIEQI